MKIAIITILIALLSCYGQGNLANNEKDIAQTLQSFESIYVSDYFSIQESSYYEQAEDSEELEDAESIETRLRFKNFTLVIHDFKGYEIIGNYWERAYYGQFGGGSHLNEGVFNENEYEDGDYKETLIVLKDTIHLSESLFDNRINNTLFQIIPNNSQYSFKVSYRYLSLLNESIDYRNYTSEELKNYPYADLIQIKEQTPFITLKDSAQYFFRALPHSPDMVEVIVVDGKVVPKKRNTQEQLDWEQNQVSNELDRIKKKYDLRDTLVVIPGEYYTVLTLTKDNKLFSYMYDSFLFQIECYKNNKLIEKKYVVIYIAYGC